MSTTLDPQTREPTRPDDTGALEGPPRSSPLTGGKGAEREAAVMLGDDHRCPGQGANGEGDGARDILVGMDHIRPPAAAAQARHGGEAASELERER